MIMMRDLIDFCIFIVSRIAVLLFGSDLGGYSYGDFLVAVLVVSVFISTLVISFRGLGGNPASAVRPPQHRPVNITFKGKYTPPARHNPGGLNSGRHK